MNPVSEDIKDMLEADSSLGLVFGTNLFIGLQPSTPANCTTIYDSGGFSPQLTLDGDGGYFYPSIQIRVRSTEYVTGWSLINMIKTLLHGRGNETWNGTLYTVIYCSSGPALLDWDENGRVNFIVNFNVQRR